MSLAIFTTNLLPLTVVPILRAARCKPEAQMGTNLREWVKSR
jgi:hypothetical protein